MLARFFAAAAVAVGVVACASARTEDAEPADSSDDDLTSASHVLFLNFEDVGIAQADPRFFGEDSSSNFSSIPKHFVDVVGADFSAFTQTTRAKMISKIAARVRTIMKPYDISVVTTRPPPSKAYTMLVIAKGADAQLGNGGVAGLGTLYGVSPIDCDNSYDRNIGFIFPDDMDLPTNDPDEAARFVAAVCAHESGHMYGLKDSKNEADVMYPYGGTQSAYGGLADVLDVSGRGDAFRVCGDARTQDSNAMMLHVLGPRR